VEYRGHDNFVFCVDQHQHMLVSGSFDETVKLWDVSSSSIVDLECARDCVGNVHVSCFTIFLFSSSSRRCRRDDDDDYLF
jgi:WD40 repeat protein